MENRHHSSRRDLEYRAAEVRAAARSCAIEVPVTALNQCGEWTNSVGAYERVEHRLDSTWRDLKHGTLADWAAASGCAIEISIAALNQSGGWKTSVGWTTRE